MAIDTLLTSEIARQRIGELVKVPEGYPPAKFRLQLFVPGTQSRRMEWFEDRSFKFEVRHPYFDCTWEFDENSEYVSALRSIRQRQREVGFTDDAQTVELHEHLNRYDRIAFHRVVLIDYQEQQEERGHSTDFLYESRDPQGTRLISLEEVLMNAFEHGSAYCEKGPVKVTFLGGKYGAVFFVDDPEKDFVLRPYSVEQLAALYSKEYGAVPKDRRTLEAFRIFDNGKIDIVDQGKYRAYCSRKFREFKDNGQNKGQLPFSRGNGVIYMTLGAKATVGFERTDYGSRVIVGYFKS